MSVTTSVSSELLVNLTISSYQVEIFSFGLQAFLMNLYFHWVALR